MVRRAEQLETIFKLVKMPKKEIVAFYPNGLIFGTDINFASITEVISYNAFTPLSYPYEVDIKEFSSFMKTLSTCKDGFVNYTPFEIQLVMGNGYKESLSMYFSVNDMGRLYQTYASVKLRPVMQRIPSANKDSILEDMFKLKVSDGAKIYNIGEKLMTSFNSIHPVNKADTVDILIRDHDEISFTAEFVIIKKDCELHELFRHRKI